MDHAREWVTAVRMVAMRACVMAEMLAISMDVNSIDKLDVYLAGRRGWWMAWLLVAMMVALTAERRDVRWAVHLVD